MSAEHSYWVYIIASRSRTLYVGVTNHLERRILQHREGAIPGFTAKYKIHRLVHFEEYGDIRVANSREKELKGWRREKKVALIETKNPAWDDLAEDLAKEKIGTSRSLTPTKSVGVRDDRAMGVGEAGGARTGGGRIRAAAESVKLGEQR